MENFKIERIYMRKLQAIAEIHNTTLNIIINQAVESSIYNYEKENGIISIDFDKLNEHNDAPVDEVKPIPIEDWWIKIERDKDGLAMEECLDFMMSNLPFVVADQCPNGGIFYQVVCDSNVKDGWRGEIDRNTDYTHYLPIPKLN